MKNKQLAVCVMTVPLRSLTEDSKDTTVLNLKIMEVAILRGIMILLMNNVL